MVGLIHSALFYSPSEARRSLSSTGLLHVRQAPHLNCLASNLPDHKDLAFKLKRKQFAIEVALNLAALAGGGGRGDVEALLLMRIFCFCPPGFTLVYYWVSKSKVKLLIVRCCCHTYFDV